MQVSFGFELIFDEVYTTVTYFKVNFTAVVALPTTFL